MTRESLISQIKEKQSYLCVGLDTDVNKIPAIFKERNHSIVEFNKKIIDATKEHCVAYKINTAFYEALGSAGWEIMEETVDYIPATHFKIADAKRGDIGNTSTQYARAFFETMDFDAVTVAPYMGEDSVRPFLEFEGKWTILLGLTSNPGSRDFEMLEVSSSRDILEEGVHIKKTESSFLYEKVLEKAMKWGSPENLMFVIGATQADAFEEIRKMVPDNFFLVPGVGAQGGSLEAVSAKGLNQFGGLLVNASRAIIYAASDESFAEEAANVAKQYQQEMARYISSML